MKKLLFTISLFALLLASSATTLAGPGSSGISTCTDNSDCGTNQLCDFLSGTCKNSLDVLTGRAAETDAVTGNQYPESKNIANLPKITLESGITTAIKTILGWAMILTIAAIVVASIFFMIARGKDEDITKAKDIILYLVIGMAIIAAAYGVVAGISQFNFFQ